MPPAARQTAVLLVLLSVLFSSQGGIAVYSLFQARQAYIIRVLCENRQKPEMQCKGKCFLKKRLADAAKEEAARNMVFAESPVLYFLLPSADEDLRYLAPHTREFAEAPAARVLEGYRSHVFSPPRTA